MQKLLRELCHCATVALPLQRKKKGIDGIGKRGQMLSPQRGFAKKKKGDKILFCSDMQGWLN